MKTHADAGDPRMNRESPASPGLEPGAGSLGSSRRGRWWTLPSRSPTAAALVTGLLAVVVYLNSLGNGFALDDVPIVLENDAIHQLSELPEALELSYWGEERGRGSGLWRPVTTTVLAVQWALWEDEPAPYHGLNLILHGGVTALATLLMAQLVPVGVAFVGGLVFAVHPVHVEAVANIIGLGELLAALFMLGACLIFLRGGKAGGEGRVAGAEGRPRLGPWRIAGISFLYALAFLTKESAAILPGLLVLLDAGKDRLEFRDLPAYLKRRGLLFGLMAVVAGGILWARFRILGSVASTVPPLGGDLLAEIPRIWTLPVVWLHYLRLLVFPSDLSPDYTPGVIEVQLGWNASNVFGVVAVLAVLGLAWAAWRDDDVPNVVTLGILWFGITVLPVANVFFLSEILLAERTLYIPSLGFAVVVGALAWHVVDRSPGLVSAAIGFVVLLMIGRTWTATPVWESTSSVMNYLLDEHPESGRVQWMWADVMLDQAGDSDTGLAAYRRALSVSGGTYAITDAAVGNLMAMGAHEQAARIARLMWNDRPEDPRGPSRLAIALSNLGRSSELVEPARAALVLNPGAGVLHHLAAIGYREREEWQDAIRHRREAIRLGEGGQWQQWRWLADLHLETGDTAAALTALDSARFRAGEPEVLGVLDSLGGVWREGSDPP